MMSAGAASRTSPPMPVAAWTSASSSVRAASPSRSRWSRRGMHSRLRIPGADALGRSRNSRRGWTNVWCGLRTARSRASADAAEAARAAVDLEPDLAAAVGAVDAPVVGELREQAQAEALGLDLERVEPAALVGDLHAREVVAEASEEHDPLVPAEAGVADGVADDLGREERHGVLDVL